MQTHHLVASDGIALVHRHGPAKGTERGVAYVAHGQAHHTLSMLPTLDGLRGHGFAVHGVDMRGHGHSTGPRAPLGHLPVNEGWDLLIGDMRLALATAFKGVPWEERLVVAPNLCALLVLEVLKEWPDLAARIVLVTPPPNQPTMVRLARGFMKARALTHAADAPDELTMHQLYGFLGAGMSDRPRMVDVLSADRTVTDALLEDEHAWPTPTTGYFHEMFRGMQSAWACPEGVRVREGTRMLILYGGDDPVTANGSFVGPMREHLNGIGIERVDAMRVEGGRPALILDERTLGISSIIADWWRGRRPGGELAGGELAGGELAGTGDVGDVSTDVLERLGLGAPRAELDADELVELCYHAIDDETRWIEMLYRVAYAIDRGGEMSVAQAEAVLGTLMPHWDRSFRINRQLMRSAAIGAVLENVIDRFSIGMAVVTPDLHVSYANEAFMAGIARVGGGPVPRDAGEAGAALRALTDDTFRARARAGEALLVVDGQAVGLHFRPVALRQTALQRGGAAGVVILRDGAGDAAAEARGDLLQFAYGLTAKEAEAASSLLEGLSPDAISRRLDVSIHTTRTHLRRVYEKVGVQGQTELTARLLSGPLGLISGHHVPGHRVPGHHRPHPA